MSPYNKALPDNVKAAGDKIISGWKDGSYDVFTGPIVDQDGKERVAKGQRMEDKDLAVIDWYVKGRAELDHAGFEWVSSSRGAKGVNETPVLPDGLSRRGDPGAVRAPDVLLDCWGGRPLSGICVP